MAAAAAASAAAAAAAAAAAKPLRAPSKKALRGPAEKKNEVFQILDVFKISRIFEVF